MQEVIRALLDRARYVYRQIPCAETDGVIKSLATALLLLEVRAARVHGRHIEVGLIADIEAATICPKCGHVQCQGHK
jgi:hypothetical protein